MTTMDKLKDACNKIVGHWYCKKINQHLIFDLNDKLLSESKLTVINTKTFETVYGVAVLPPNDIDDIDKLYFDINRWELKQYFEIMNLTKELLVIKEFKNPYKRKYISPDLIYTRVPTDLNTADEILKEIDLE